ncbi:MULTISPECIES: CDP-alcohol phosphatidyltransferase family protein [unclassified Hahella]|uniref:CDP-alcohol phosphatidyltransferase family protein n=1 Tax=unclassified Hahella TaxID=2624107 RepID=UPI0020A6253C|nr:MULTISPECIES: CDP-alcohol phosphatidyltransferase family protein [unclassified Hahella]MDG9671749.1 CDP-alcohol phosphatidyltransferase family protein [Hahella sp. CR1]
MAGGKQDLRLEWRHIPNVITVLRIFLVGPIAYCLARELYREAMWLFFVAGVSDALDGFLARACKWSSRFGAVTDPLADKALLVTVFIVLTYNEVLPLWLTLLVFARDVIIVAGALTYHKLVGAYKMQPSLWGKLSTLSQITFILAVILNLAGIAMPPWALEGGVWVVALTSCISGAHYVILWGGRFYRARNGLAK